MSILAGLDDCPLDRKTPFGMNGVSRGILSIARHYGGCTFQDRHYIYFAQTDELIRDDVLKWKKQERQG